MQRQSDRNSPSLPVWLHKIRQRMPYTGTKTWTQCTLNIPPAIKQICPAGAIQLHRQHQMPACYLRWHSHTPETQVNNMPRLKPYISWYPICLMMPYVLCENLNMKHTKHTNTSLTSDVQLQNQHDLMHTSTDMTVTGPPHPQTPHVQKRETKDKENIWQRRLTQDSHKNPIDANVMGLLHPDSTKRRAALSEYLGTTWQTHKTDYTSYYIWYIDVLPTDKYFVLIPCNFIAFGPGSHPSLLHGHPIEHSARMLTQTW